MISSIHVANFRGLKECALDNLNAATFLTGLNGQGKTSLLQAVKFALTGTVHNQDYKRFQLAELIGPWGREAAITLTIEADEALMLECRVNIKKHTLRVVNATGKEVILGSPEEVRAALWQRLGADWRFVPAGLDPRASVLGDIAQVVAEMSGGVDGAALERLCGDHWEWLMAFTQPRKLTLLTMPGLDRVGQAAYDARTEANRTAKGLRDELAKLTPAAQPRGGDGKPVAAAAFDLARQQLSTLRTERDDLQREIGRNEGRRPGEIILAELRKAEAAAKKLTPPAVDVEAAHKDHLAAARNFDQAKIANNSATDILNRIHNELKGLGGDTGCCPTCRRNYSKADAAALVGPVQERLDRQKKAVIEASAAVDKANAKATEAARALADAQAARSDYDAAYRDLDGKCRALRDEEPAADDVETLTAKLAALDDRIGKGEALIASMAAWVHQEKLRGQLIEVEAEIERLNWAISAFRDGAVTNQLGGDAQAEFLRTVNARLQQHGFTLSFAGEGSNIRAMLDGGGKPARPVAGVSDGELLLVQLAVAEAFGQGLVILDALNDLDGRHKQTLFASMRTGGAFLVAGAWGLPGEVTAETAGYLDPVSVVWVQDGVAEVVEPAGRLAAA